MKNTCKYSSLMAIVIIFIISCQPQTASVETEVSIPTISTETITAIEEMDRLNVTFFGDPESEISDVPAIVDAMSKKLTDITIEKRRLSQLPLEQVNYQAFYTVFSQSSDGHILALATLPQNQFSIINPIDPISTSSGGCFLIIGAPNFIQENFAEGSNYTFFNFNWSKPTASEGELEANTLIFVNQFALEYQPMAQAAYGHIQGNCDCEDEACTSGCPGTVGPSGCQITQP